jgi:ubiquinone/menaquinone biosynthesis C-methylase UbiE
MSDNLPSVLGDPAVLKVQAYWDKFSSTYTERFNSYWVEASKVLHAHMELASATAVLEIGAGSGLGTLDILQYVDKGRLQKILATDVSPNMLQLLRERLQPFSESFPIEIAMANGKCMPFMHRDKTKNHIKFTAQSLDGIPNGSYDRYIAGLVLQLVPNPDLMLRECKRVLVPKGGLAGFVIWGAPERSGLFTIPTAMQAEIQNGTGEPHNSFKLGANIDALKARMRDTFGFRHVLVWSTMCVYEKWSAEAFADNYDEDNPIDDEAFRQQRRECLIRLASAWLASGKPIGLECYVVIAQT